MHHRGAGRSPGSGRLLATLLAVFIAGDVIAVDERQAPAPGAGTPGAAAGSGTPAVDGAAPPDPLAEARRLSLDRKWAQAVSAARAVVDSEAAAGRPDSLLTAKALDLLLGALWRWRNVDPVADPALAARAAALKESLVGPDSPGLAISLSNVGMIDDAIAEYDRAIPPLERALAIRERAFGPGHVDVAVSLRNLGRVRWGMGDFAAARQYHERALAIRTKLHAADDPHVAAALVDVALDLKALGEYTAARPMFERALAILAEKLGPDDPQVAVVSTDLGEVLDELGDHVGSERLYRRALEIEIEAYGPDHGDVGRDLSHLGFALHGQGRLEEAQTVFERALVVRERAVGPAHPGVLTTLGGLAGVLGDRGDLPAARALLESALARAEETLGANHPAVASYSADLADVCRETGDLDRARELIGRALAIRERVLGEAHPHTAEARIAVARVLRAEGDDAGALEAALQAQAILRDHLRRTTGALAEREALRYAATMRSGLEVALSSLFGGIAAGDGDAARRTWDEVVRSRALVLDEIAARHRLVSEADDPAVVAAATALERARARLSGLIVRGPDPDHPELYSPRIRQAIASEEAAERGLADASRLFRRGEERRAIGLANTLSAIPAGGALVAYVQFRPVARGGDPETDAPRYAALVARAGSPGIRLVRLGTVAEIDGRVARWRHAVATPPVDRADLAQRRTAGEALREAIWDPVSAAVAGVRQVFVVPEGSLHLVALAALPTGGDRYLLETGPTLHHVSAERDLIPEGKPPAPGGGLLVLGDPDFDARPALAARPTAGAAAAAGAPASTPARVAARPTYRGRAPECSGFKILHFDPLPNAGEEAKEVAGLWGRLAAAGAPEPLVLTSRGATEAAFKTMAPGRRILHLATHGFFLDESCDAPDGGGDRGVAAGAAEGPLHIAGLALAGANRRDAIPPGSDAEDGVLTAEEIASLDLRGVEWAVLSACGTGVGRVQAGEGVLGLRRAFQIAGARTVLMSLWSVDDQTARDWIRGLYESRANHRTTAEAVREASLRILDNRRRAGVTTDPFYWGAFVAAGDWR